MKVYLLEVNEKYDEFNFVSKVFCNKEKAEKEKSLREKEDRDNEEDDFNYRIVEKEVECEEKITLEDIHLIALDIAEITYEVCGIENAITDCFLAGIGDYIFGPGDEFEIIERKIIEKYQFDEIEQAFFEGELHSSFEHIAFALYYTKGNENNFIKIVKQLRKDYGVRNN